MRERSRARGWALQALYAWEMRGAEPETALRVLHDLAEDLRVSQENRFFAEVLVRIVSREQSRLDRLIQDQLANWRLERLSVIDRNILRVGAAEFLFVDDVPVRITIREMLRLGERYSTPESPRFLNGVLDAIARHAAPEKVAEGG
ncbi:MAG: transcription antitermination factor NusB [Gemmatimonadetes bacterium]|nr:transcription antitermination factor NusB [Gemmatimonadota bacterium]